jgi:hypothetical protein
LSERRIAIPAAKNLPPFDRQFFDGRARITCIGEGAVGGKASGLAFMSKILSKNFDGGVYDSMLVDIPRLTVLATGVFDAFMNKNKLWDVALSDDSDDYVAFAFQAGDFPTTIIGDLRALVEKVRQPLAIRSSSLLEDAMFEPFAGVYGTKMIPNNQPDADTRFRKLIEAIKYVYASTFFKEAKAYIRMTDRSSRDEKMAVIIQEVVGRRFQERFYPTISGVARSYSFYPIGRASPEDGVVNLALGLGKTIVDGGKCWTYSPTYPNIDPPLTADELFEQTQTEFWAVNMGRPPAFDPIRETEYLQQGSLDAAHMDDTLRYVASTYNVQNDRIVPGVAVDGPRLLNFAPVLRLSDIPLNDLIRRILKLCEEAVGTQVEMEFALTIERGAEPRARFGFLQVRPMVVSHDVIEVDEPELYSDDALLASDRAMGNGVLDTVSDIVYVKPDGYEAKNNPAIAAELDQINRTLLADSRPYLLIGFGRWGSSDYWLGIPVNWSQISGARVLVEATLPNMNVELSQGSHFFHNITSFQIFYFSVRHDSRYCIDWEWLKQRDTIRETHHVRHVRTESPLTVKVDGRHSRGVVLS